MEAEELKYSECRTDETSMVAEDVTPMKTGQPKVIPFVSPEEAAAIFSSQRVLFWEEKVEQINLSLGRLS